MANTLEVGGQLTVKLCIKTIQWTIPDIYEKLFRPGENYDFALSPNIDETESSCWNMLLFVRKNQLGCCFQYSVESKQDDNPKSLLDVSLGSKENCRVITKYWNEAKKSENGLWTFHSSLSISELDKNKNTLLEDDTLRVCIYMEILTNDRNAGSMIEQSKHSNGLQSDFENLFYSKKFTNVVIKCGNQKFNCHKNILSARSNVFANLLSSGTKEQERAKAEICIEDLDPTIVLTILHYIYTGKVKALPESCSLVDLAIGAEKYDLKELKRLCFQKLMEDVTLENAGEFAVAAYISNADEETQKFIKDYCHENLKSLMNYVSFRKLVYKYPKALNFDE